ncbi:MAG: GMC family oxidoreductase [Rhodothermales bacterium]|nr:GMC family oxidoreductase [Rhodothermales bacterium]
MIRAFRLKRSAGHGHRWGESVNLKISKRFDAIVVGSGITGGWAAKELTEKGLNVLVIERGRMVEHGKDYVTEHTPAWEFDFRGMGDRSLHRKEYAVQSTCYAFGEASKHFFVNDAMHPYETPDDKPFRWIRGYHLGGRSLTWGRQVYRWGQQDFAANEQDGIAVDWPIRYEDIEPWYDYVEPFVGISGMAEGLAHVPDGIFQGAMPLNCVEQKVKEGLASKYNNRLLTIGRVAVITKALNGRAPCHYCGPCHRGCSTGSYFSSLSATLPAALKTGLLTIRTDSIVESLLYDPGANRVSGVRVIDANTMEEEVLEARVVFMCASTLGSTQVLLNSTSREFPDGLGNSSGVLGHYLMDHPFQTGATGDMAGFDNMYHHGNRPTGIYVPRFRNLGSDKTPDFIRGYAYQGGAYREGWGRGITEEGFGADLKNRLRKPGKWSIDLHGFGECLPRYENHARLHPNRKDRWGIPILEINCSWSDNETNMRADMAIQAAEMLEASGCHNVRTWTNFNPPGYGIHEMGTARMGRDPKTSYLNAYNQSHDVPNLFVTDGSCMTSSACQNPSITYMALTARACDFAVGEMRDGRI